MLKLILFLMFLTLISLSLAPTSAHQKRADFSELEKVVTQELDRTGTPGAAVAVVSGDRVVFSRGFGVASVETGNPVTTDMLFQLGSVTKTFNAAAIVSLAEEGRLKLDQPIGAYVKHLSPKLSRVTLGQLLSHTAGLKDEPDEYGSHDESALAAYVGSWSDDYCLFEPGEVFSYSNSGAALAGFVMQEIIGKPYADQMTERLFKPLGMVRTTLRPTVAMTYPLAVGHKGQKAEVVRPMADDSRLWPAGNIFSTAADVSRFMIALLNEGKVDGKQALSPRLLKVMSTPRVDVVTLPLQAGYCYGLFTDDQRGVRRLWHDGSMPGYTAEVVLVPEHRFGVVVLANKEGIRLDEIADKTAELLLPLTSKSEAKPKPSLPLDSAEMSLYAGVYSNPNRWSVELLSKDGKLFIKQFGSELPVRKIGDRRFSFQFPGRPDTEEFVIKLGAGGKPAYLQEFIWAFKRVS